MQLLTKPIAERANRFATRVVDESSDPRKNSFMTRRADLIGAVTDAIHNFLAVRRARFPNRTSQLLTRFASDRLPGSTVRALRTVADETLRAVISKPRRNPVRISPPRRSARTSDPRVDRKRSVRLFRRKAPPKVRQILSHCAVFVPTEGLCIHRTTRKAKAAGFDSIAAWVASLTASTPTVRYREAAKALARRVVNAEIERGVHTERTMTELILEAEAAIGFCLGSRVARFPRLASRLLTRFADGSLPHATILALRQAAHIAVKARVERPVLNYTYLFAAAAD